MPDAATDTIRFADLGLDDRLLKAVESLGYETPSPIQAAMIPHMLAGRDVLGQAQTGTGKTAAFALPLLSTLDFNQRKPQVLVLTPTRELAIQVAEAFQRYAADLKGFHVLPIYGGQDYRVQLNQLARHPQVIVGTPGRVMDHMRRGTLALDQLRTLVLDEADEMLRMGFIDDVEWILSESPSERQIALFSATMPREVKRIADQHLRNPEEITIKVKTQTADTISQRYWLVSGVHKLDALTRILEVETFDGMIIFVRTKTATTELAEKLEARGYSAVALNGDIPQKLREQTVNKLKSGKLDILVATDVAARGLDVERISHVVNYDIPHDTESYVHRIGRTGRAGRSGEAILFVAPRERRMLAAIERATNQKITEMRLPSTEDIKQKRVARFMQQISDTLAAGELDYYRAIIETYENEHNVPALDIASALAKLAQGGKSLQATRPEPAEKTSAHEHRDDSPRRSRRDQDQERRREKYGSRQNQNAADDEPAPQGMERFRVEVGHNHQVKPGNIMGAIANEAGIDGAHIGRIRIFNDYSTIDLPEGMPKAIYQDLKKTRVAGQPLNISRAGRNDEPQHDGNDKKPRRTLGIRNEGGKPAGDKSRKPVGDKPRKPFAKRDGNPTAPGKHKSSKRKPKS